MSDRSLRHLLASTLVYVDNAATLAEFKAERGDPMLTGMYRRSAQRAKRIVGAALRALTSVPPLPYAFLACDGKGGQYELAGLAKGAGPLKGQEVIVYRDAATGALYFRGIQDFQERMTLAGGGYDVNVVVKPEPIDVKAGAA